MAPRIYTSSFPPTERPEKNIYSYVLPPAKDDAHAAHKAQFIDAETGLVLTRGELRTKTLEFAYGLRHVLHGRYGGPKLERGDTILVFSPNSIAYPIVLLGASAGGIKTSPANASFTPAELAYQFTDSGAKLMFVHPENLPVALKMFEQQRIPEAEARKRIVITGWGLERKGPSGFVQMDDLLGKGSIGEAENFDGPLAHEAILLCYSSGTTGKPKGVMSTHRNIGSSANMTNMGFPLDPKEDVTIGVMPFFHIFGAKFYLHTCVLRSIPVVVVPRFDPDVFCRIVERYKVTFSIVVPPVLVVFARHSAVAQNDMKSLQRLLCGGAPLGPGLVREVTNRFNSYGVNTKILQAYGLTESTLCTHIQPMADAERKVGTCGLLCPNLEARLVLDNGDDADAGEQGELWLRGPTIMKGYLNNEKATMECITPDGWFKTGDIATIDSEGFMTITDRKKELIKYKGYQVAPAELEAVLLQHPDVADAGVVGIYWQEEATELPRAYVVPAKVIDSDRKKAEFGADIQKWMETRVARHKYLRGGVAVVNLIPKSPSGKILRRELREVSKRENEAGQLPRARAKL